MNREEFCRAYAAEYGTTLKYAREACYTIFEFLGKKILEEDRVYLLNFGTFKRQETKPHRIWNVNKQEYTTTPAGEKVIFKPSPGMGVEVESEEEFDEDYDY